MTQKYESKIIVLKKTIDEKEASELIDGKKTSVFKTLLKRPKKTEVHVDSITLVHECLLKISGTYVADYYRKAIHTLSVDSNVQEVALGSGSFPIKEKSVLKKAFSAIGGKNKIDLPLEEHVYVEQEDEIVFDHNGNIVNFPYSLNSKTMENYPDQILETNSKNVKNPQITKETAIGFLKEFLKKPLEKDIRKLNENFTVKEITEVYVPIYEARLTGPKNKVGLLRLDAVRKKIL